MYKKLPFLCVVFCFMLSVPNLSASSGKRKKTPPPIAEARSETFTQKLNPPNNSASKRTSTAFVDADKNKRKLQEALRLDLKKAQQSGKDLSVLMDSSFSENQEELFERENQEKLLKQENQELKAQLAHLLPSQPSPIQDSASKENKNQATADYKVPLFSLFVVVVGGVLLYKFTSTSNPMSNAKSKGTLSH